MIVLDSDICAEVLRGNHDVIRIRSQAEDGVGISFMTAAELVCGDLASLRRPCEPVAFRLPMQTYSSSPQSSNGLPS